MKSIILAALLGAMTVEDVTALRLAQSGPASNASEVAAAAAEKAGVVDKEKENKATIKSQQGAEQKESQAAEAAAAALTKQIEARINAESQNKLNKAESKKASAEEREAALHIKITEEVKERKKINDEILEAAMQKARETTEENEIRHRKLHEERKQAIANIEAETASLTAQQQKIARLSSEQRSNLTDEEWVANLPEHHLAGYVGVEDDIEDGSEADEEDGGDKDLVGVEDDDMYADEDAAVDANNEEDDEDDNNMEDAGSDEDNQDGGDKDLAQAENNIASLAQKPSGHLHKTSIRVDPPLTTDGKKSIEEAEKQLNEAKTDYDKLKEKAQDLEFKFKSAARISRHAREGKGESEDAYYIAEKNQRKAARHAENLAREAQRAAAKQAAADKYNEVISTANAASSAGAKKPDGPAAKTEKAPEKAADKPAEKAASKAQLEKVETKSKKAKTLVQE